MKYDAAEDKGNVKHEVRESVLESELTEVVVECWNGALDYPASEFYVLKCDEYTLIRED